MPRDFTGKLLVASPALTDPNFRRAVVLVCAHSPGGAFGLILNRPLDSAPVAEHLPGWAEHTAAPSLVFLGGPVEPTVAFALAAVPEGGTPSGTLTPVVPGIAQLDLANSDPLFHPVDVRVRVFVGYAGWGPGQLDGEVGAEGWFVVDPDPGDAFTADPASLWHVVLRRQPGRLAMFAFVPADPRTN